MFYPLLQDHIKYKQTLINGEAMNFSLYQHAFKFPTQSQIVKEALSVFPASNQLRFSPQKTTAKQTKAKRKTSKNKTKQNKKSIKYASSSCKCHVFYRTLCIYIESQNHRIIMVGTTTPTKPYPSLIY